VPVHHQKDEQPPARGEDPEERPLRSRDSGPGDEPDGTEHEDLSVRQSVLFPVSACPSKRGAEEPHPGVRLEVTAAELVEELLRPELTFAPRRVDVATDASYRPHPVAIQPESGLDGCASHDR